jgi:L-rhamnose isomerase
MREAETSGDLTKRLAMLEEIKMLPAGAIWDQYCEQSGTPTGLNWLDEVRRYESTVQSKRS